MVRLVLPEAAVLPWASVIVVLADRPWPQLSRLLFSFEPQILSHRKVSAKETSSNGIGIGIGIFNDNIDEKQW